MSTCLHPCPSCARHVRGTEAECPFCAAALPEGFGSCRAAARARPMSRAALLFVGATTAAACGGAVEPAGGSGDAALDTRGGGDAAGYEGGGVTLYGPAPQRDAAGSDADAGGPLPMYGPAP